MTRDEGEQERNENVFKKNRKDLGEEVKVGHDGRLGVEDHGLGQRRRRHLLGRRPSTLRFAQPLAVAALSAHPTEIIFKEIKGHVICP